MKLFSKFEDIFYDILGYLVPGFCAVIFLLPFLLHHKSFAGYIFTYGTAALFYELSSLFSSYQSAFVILLLVLLSYILGHAIHMIPILWKCLQTKWRNRTRITNRIPRQRKPFRPFTNWINSSLIKKYNYTSQLEKSIMAKFKENGNPAVVSYLSDNLNPKAVLKAYASATSRFRCDESNITKYHNKVKLFESLRVLAKLLFIDFATTTVLSLVMDSVIMIQILAIVYSQSQSGFCHFCVTAVMQIAILIVKPLIPKLLVCLETAFFYLTFYYEMQRHRILSEKELYLYINYLLEEKQE